MINSCPFCDTSRSVSKKIHSYALWDLFLHADDKREKTRQAAGFLALRRHEPNVIDIAPEEWLELQQAIGDAAQRLCDQIGVTYTSQEVVGFNRGADAGQTVQHAHVHILPIAEEDEPEMKVRAGIGGAFEALRRERMNVSG